jgi:hypothetical protein
MRPRLDHNDDTQDVTLRGSSSRGPARGRPNRRHGGSEVGMTTPRSVRRRMMFAVGVSCNEATSSRGDSRTPVTSPPTSKRPVIRITSRTGCRSLAALDVSTPAAPPGRRTVAGPNRGGSSSPSWQHQEVDPRVVVTPTARSSACTSISIVREHRTSSSGVTVPGVDAATSPRWFVGPARSQPIEELVELPGHRGRIPAGDVLAVVSNPRMGLIISRPLVDDTHVPVSLLGIDDLGILGDRPHRGDVREYGRRDRGVRHLRH